MDRRFRFSIRSLFVLSAFVILIVISAQKYLDGRIPITKGKVLESIPRIRKLATSLGTMHGVRLGDRIVVVSEFSRFTGSVTKVREDISIVEIDVLPSSEFPVAGDVVEFAAPIRAVGVL